MPFQSEKQRRYLHANHPEIAKRWERDYANGGISNHFRKKFDKGSDYGQFERRQAHNVAAGSQAMNVGGGQGNQGNGGGGPKPHSGPTLAEIEAQKKAAAAAEAARLQALEDARSKQMYDTTMAKRKKNIKYYDKNLKSKFDTPTWDTDIISINLEDLKPKKTLDDYFNQLDETNVPLSDWEQKHMEELENQNRLEFEDEFKKKEGISNEKLMYPPPGNLAFKVGSKKDKQLKSLHKERALTKDLGIPFPAKKEKKYQKLLKEDQEQTEHPKSELLTAALGGVARKNYFHGGILDINESEEIISDDGNDIELTAYNAAFDDPNDLSTGVKSLFRAKNGGSYAMQGGVKNYLGNQEMVNAPKHWKSAPDHPDTELTYITKPEKDLLVKADLHGSLHGSVNKGPSDIISLNGWGDAGDFDGPSSSTGGGAPPGEKGGPGYVAPTRSRIQDERAEDNRKKEIAKIIATGPGSDEEKYDTDLVDMKGKPVMKPEENYLARRNMIKSKYTGRSIQRKDALTNNYNKEKARLESKVNWAIVPKILGGLFGGPLTVGWGDIKTVKNIMDLDKLKKQHIGDLTDIKDSLLADVDINNPNEMKNLDDTAFSEVMKELTELNKPKDDDDTGGDGPEPIYTPLTGEVSEEYAQGLIDPRDWMAEIRARQAAREAAVPDWQLTAEERELKNNPIVMTANRGGLANLFRVKNQ